MKAKNPERSITTVLSQTYRMLIGEADFLNRITAKETPAFREWG
jgi:hypothetical protein